MERLAKRKDMITKQHGSSRNGLSIDSPSLENGKSKLQGSNREALESRMTRRNRQNKQEEWEKFEGLFHKDLHTDSKVQKDFLLEIAKLLNTYMTDQFKGKVKVVDFHHPHQLREMLNDCLTVDADPRDLHQVLSDCKETLKYCVKSGHPHFLNQLSTGLDVVGVAGEWLTAVVNTNMFTFEVGPVFVLMEDIILHRMRSFIGWKDGGDGIFTPGGTISNLYALMLARHRKFPEMKENGMCSEKKFVVYTSAQSHFSIKKAAILLGIGTNNVCSIPCDERGKLRTSDLDREIQNTLSSGGIPLMVNATCGTTVLGAYDPVDKIADICQKYDVWLHVDGAWGGSALLSKKYKHLLHGVHRCDSMTWNPHKLMGVPLQCSAILVRNSGELQSANELCADYLYQTDKFYDVTYDTGDRSIQCGRHNDVFKLWLMWRSKGDAGFEDFVNKNFQLSRYLERKVKERKHFTPVMNEAEGPSVCFWYEPPQIFTPNLSSSERRRLLNKVAPIIKESMTSKGSMMLAYQPLGDIPNFFRIAISNPRLTEGTLDWVLDEIERLSRDIFIEE
ncbi:glutamate decarboxylase 1-like [Ostrea edulis]|uniref:glutamate decarboxylase 1-like n=1 Tax=Ostrea edulis TaxID=37623 RepID=UPI0020947BB8|nr:glutamate decarboxylase 1-like [Ostrea edulis]